ncbi:MAG: hypothetical protein KAJ18_03250 [Candidatus Omnitrophica bacterium]|nr:hypothetical protein [Candidatus Omnitrophota bacterium]
MKSIFSDKATVVIRAMLAEPQRKWTVRDFEAEFNVGRSRAAQVLAELRKKGFVGGVTSGRKAYSQLTDKEGLINEWLRVYNFELNENHLYYSESDILKTMKVFLENRKWEDKYALTLHTGANLISNYVNTPVTYCYLDSHCFKEMSLEIRQALDLKELKRGGNICFIKPYYKNSVFFHKQKIKGLSVVSNLQLYLDLYHFPQRGREHADYLLKVLKEKEVEIG